MSSKKIIAAISEEDTERGAKEEADRKAKDKSARKVESLIERKAQDAGAAATSKQKITIYLSMTNVKTKSSFCKVKLTVWSPSV